LIQNDLFLSKYWTSPIGILRVALNYYVFGQAGAFESKLKQVKKKIARERFV